MYKTYFGIREKPFSIAPDPSFLFMSEQHREALAHLMYGVDCDSGFVLLTGDIGTGKTTICRCLLEQIPTTSDVAFIINPKLSVAELLAAICDEFGIKYPQNGHSIKLFIDRINRFLLQAHAQGRSPVLIIDEAQNLSNEVLEQIRLLTNLETNERKLLLIIMIGQPELRDKLAKQELTQLQQRITARYHLKPLSKIETAAYIRHRLSIAGLKHRLFLKSALGNIYNLSHGVPRVINLLCDRAMLGAYAQGKTTINKQTVTTAANEIFGLKKSQPGPYLPSWQRKLISPFAFAILLTFFVISPFTEMPWATKVVDKLQQTTSLALYSELQRLMPQPEAQNTEPRPIISQNSIEKHIAIFQDTDSSITHPIKNNPVRDELIWPQIIPIEESKVIAFSSLFQQWSAPYNPQNHISACKQAQKSGLSCLFKQGNMGSLRRVNRPAVMKMINKEGQEYFATIVALGKDEATLILGGDPLQVSLDDLEKQWSGSYTLLWKMPPDYDKAILPGESTQWLPWLAQQFSAPQANDHLGGILLGEVKKFQKANGLMADGIVGPQTIISLNNNSPDSHVLPMLNNRALAIDDSRDPPKIAKSTGL